MYTNTCTNSNLSSVLFQRGDFHQKLIAHGSVEENYEIPPFTMNPPNLTEILSMMSESERKRKTSDEPLLENNPGRSPPQNPQTQRKKRLKVAHKSGELSHTPSSTITTAVEHNPENRESPDTPVAST